MQTWVPYVGVAVTVIGAAVAIMRAMFRIGQQLEERFHGVLTKAEHSDICQRNQEQILEKIDTLAQAVTAEQATSRKERAHLRETVQQLAVKVAVLADRSDPR